MTRDSCSSRAARGLQRGSIRDWLAAMKRAQGWAGMGQVAIWFGAWWFAACAPFAVPHEWPVSVSPDRKAVRQLDDVVICNLSVDSLTKQEQALLTFLADPEHLRKAVGKPDNYGTHNWRIAEIFLVKPGREVSVLCEEGHMQEPLYFRYNPANSVWYRVADFESDKTRAVAAVVVK